jgi:hypothetical protein
MFEEAATCYLKALSLNPEAKHIWSSLRVVFNAQGRLDLATRCQAVLHDEMHVQCHVVYHLVYRCTPTTYPCKDVLA